MAIYKIANVIIETHFTYAYSAHVLKPYLYKGERKAQLKIEITPADIEIESQKSEEKASAFVENLVFFRKFAEYIVKNANATVFHCSAVEVDGKAYLFTAPSGTGKSTHARLWLELLGDKAKIINDDKPVVGCEDGEFFVYGTPWQGKHDLGYNAKVKIAGICLITQAKTNAIKQVPSQTFLPVLLNQTARAVDEEHLDKLLGLLTSLLKVVKTYVLECNTDIESARISYGAMAKE